MRPVQDSHSTESPQQVGAILWIIGGLLSAVAVFMVILWFVPKG